MVSVPEGKRTCTEAQCRCKRARSKATCSLLLIVSIGWQAMRATTPADAPASIGTAIGSIPTPF